MKNKASLLFAAFVALLWQLNSPLFAQQPAALAVPAQALQAAIRAVKVQPAATASGDAAATDEDAEAAEAEGDAAPDAAEGEAAAKPADKPAAEMTEEEKAKAEAEKEKAKAKAAEKKRRADAEKRKKARLQKLKKLNFDRRASSALKAWSTPLEADKEEEKKEEEKPVAVTVKTDEGFVVRGLLRFKDDQQVIVDTLDGRRFAIPQTAIDEMTEDEVEVEEKPEPTEEQKQQAEQAKEQAEKNKAFDRSVLQFQRDVTLGKWAEVKKFLAGFDEELGKATYTRMLQSLLAGPGKQPPRPGQPAPRPVPSQGRRFLETNQFSNEDIIALADVSPYEMSDTDRRSLAGILRKALTQGNVVAELVAGLKDYHAGEDAKLSQRQCAELILAANQPLYAKEFLPDLATAKQEQDHQALNMLSKYYLALNAKEKKTENLEKAWEVTQAILASDEIKKEEKDEALKRAVELAPQLQEQMGEKWLAESFTKNPTRGMEILAAIGTATSRGLQMQPSNPQSRLKSLKLQHTAVESLLESSPEQAKSWQSHLALLGANWLREGMHSYKYDDSKTLMQQMQRDRYGNFFYDPFYYNRRSVNSGAKAITTGDLLEVRPSEKWLELVSAGIKPKYDMLYAQLYLKVAEDQLAYPYIESLATSHPKIAQDLVDEYIRVWTENHDPNSNRRRTNSYMFMYGYEQKADGIPLTRSKQQRNLEELSQLVKKLKQLPVELDEELLARAFTTCHSQAEVYHLGAIEKVFGSLAEMEPKTLAEMAQQMRSNLLGIWRDPATQKSSKTNRKKKDIQAEVQRGYTVARNVVLDGLKKYPEDWSLQLALAAINHDENDYKAELEKDSKFSKRRAKSFAEFKKAAELYIAGAGELEQDKETTRPFEIWWYASLGACDLGRIDDKKQPDLTQPAIIKTMLESLPGAQAERHRELFANSLFTRMSSIKPAVKYRYLKTGFEIVGDHKAAAEARKVFDYYNDLVTEIRLETEIDGSDVVGQEPFGVFVNLVHTREIERESGGFGKYLQNQNNGNRFFYNYGRPTENYRDKFEEIVTEALEEKFDILSITFQREDINSRALPEYGWRVTPYAYLLLKARGPEADKLAPVRLDLDFLDTSGYAVLPVESGVVPLVAAKTSGARPVQNIRITQTLDERQADEGKLILEIKAVGQGLIPELETLLDLKPEEFDIAGIEDQGISVSQFDAESDENVVISERTWQVTLAGKEGLAEHPKTFQFAALKRDDLMARQKDSDQLADDALVYQRFVDADLESVEQNIGLEEVYGETSQAWVWWLLAACVVGALVLGGLYATMPGERQVQTARFSMPTDVTPFSVLGLLKDIEANNGLPAERKTELSSSINRIESYYFGATNGQEEPKLEKIAQDWVRQTS